MTLIALAQEKLKDIKLNHSKGTYKFYKSHLEHFLTWCKENHYHTTDEFNDDALIDYVNFQKQTASASTINKRIGILKRTYQFSKISFPFLENMKKFKERYRTYSAIDFETYSKIRNYVFSYPVLNKNHLMHKALLALLVDSGARIDELLNIRIDNINLNNYEIVLTKTKMNIDRTIYFTEKTAEILSELIKHNTHSHFLLYNFDKNRVAIYEDARYLMKKLKNTFNIKKLHTHMFRHTIATLMVEKGADLFSIMKILGHLNVKTTQRYTHVSNWHVKKNYKEIMGKLE